MKTILLVRHADIDELSEVPPGELVGLNAAGRARAAELSRVAVAAGVTAVFTGPARRARETGAAAAAALALTAQALVTPQQVAAAARADAAGPVVLIVGHGDTIPQILKEFGAAVPGSVAPGFDDLFVVTSGASAARLKYGAAPAQPPGTTLTDRAGRTAPGRPVTLTGELFAGKGGSQLSVSGGAVRGDLLMLVADEMKKPTAVQVLRRTADNEYKAVGLVKLRAGDDETDLEAVAVDGDTIYVTGSHAWTRKIDGAAIGDPKRKEAREQFFRFELRPDGTAGDMDGPKSLRPALVAHPVLGGFIGVASKENGIDIEGLAVKDGRLHFGFRGPVLRDGWAPVLSCTWADPTGTARVRYVRLGGRGIRDLVAVQGGFLVLAGPVGDGDASFRVYFWDGADQLPAGPSSQGALQLAEFSSLGAGRPEGLVVLDESGPNYELMVLFDGLPGGGPRRWTLAKL